MKLALALLTSVFLAGTLGEHPSTASADQGDSAITPAMVAQGDSIFHGKAAGGICFSCHGPNAKGIKGLAPDLTDAKWLHGDGSFQFLQTIIEKGVPKPKENAAPMPAKGGAPLSPAQVRALAAYVLSLRTSK